MKKTISMLLCTALMLLLLVGCSGQPAACEHEYTSSVTKESTYEAEGEMTYVCNKCEHTYTEPIAKLEKHVVSTSVLDKALSNAKYYSSPFSISIGELVNSTMDTYDIRYMTGEEAIAEGYFSKNNIDSSVDIDYMYFAIISGDTMINPSIPYLTEYEAEAVKAWMLFDENDKLLNYGVELCDNLQTCAILMMTTSY